MSITIEWQALFDASPNAYMVLDRGFRFVAANEAYLRLTAKSRDRLLGRHVFEVFPHDPANPDNESVRRLRQSLERVLETGRADVLALISYRVPRAGQDEAAAEERFWSATHSPVTDATGAVQFILQHTVDVTERQRQELTRADLLAAEQSARAAAEAAERRQRFLAEAIPQQVWTATPDGALDFINRPALEYYGAGPDEVLGAGWVSVVHPDDLARSLEYWQRSLDTGDVYEIEFRLRRADGTFRWHLGRAMPYRDPNGRILKWFGTNTDMDDLKRTRDELQKRAEFDQQLIGIVSHDLRNPLNAIGLGTSLLLQRGRLDEQQGKVVARIISSHERASRLINDFLDFTQARASGHIPIHCVPANIREIAQEVFDELHLSHPERIGTLEHTGTETGEWDRDRIAQLLSNLVGNAFQHSPAHGTVRVTTRGDEDQVLIEVQNDGVPISPQDASRLFEPFQRGKNTKASSARSVGLGLYISRQIVQAHGGTIAVRSSAEAGTVFTVRLPRRFTPDA